MNEIDKLKKELDSLIDKLNESERTIKKMYTDIINISITPYKIGECVCVWIDGIRIKGFLENEKSDLYIRPLTKNNTPHKTKRYFIDPKLYTTLSL